MSSHFWTPTCRTAGSKGGSSIADSPVFDDEVDFDFEELEARHAS